MTPLSRKNVFGHAKYSIYSDLAQKLTEQGAKIMKIVLHE